jgi:hypothetical protein
MCWDLPLLLQPQEERLYQVQDLRVEVVAMAQGQLLPVPPVAVAVLLDILVLVAMARAILEHRYSQAPPVPAVVGAVVVVLTIAVVAVLVAVSESMVSLAMAALGHHRRLVAGLAAMDPAVVAKSTEAEAAVVVVAQVHRETTEMPPVAVAVRWPTKIISQLPPEPVYQ